MFVVIPKPILNDIHNKNSDDRNRESKNARNIKVTTTRIIIKHIFDYVCECKNEAKCDEYSCQPKTWITEILVRD